jgi:hypothetical protein
LVFVERLLAFLALARKSFFFLPESFQLFLSKKETLAFCFRWRSAVSR